MKCLQLTEVVNILSKEKRIEKHTFGNMLRKAAPHTTTMRLLVTLCWRQGGTDSLTAGPPLQPRPQPKLTNTATLSEGSQSQHVSAQRITTASVVEDFRLSDTLCCLMCVRVHVCV